MSRARYLLDKDVLIRFLTHDEPVLSARADQLFCEADKGGCILILTDIVVAETVWSLSKAYKIDRAKVADSMKSLLVKAGISSPNRDCLLDALDRFKSTGCDFPDCYLAALAVNADDAVASFDKDMRKFKDVKLWKCETK